MTNILRQSTAVDVLIGPFVSTGDGFTTDSGVAPTVSLSKNGQAVAAKSDVTVPTHDSQGYYNCELDATDTNTVGTMVLMVEGDTGWLPVRHEYQVVEEAAYDKVFATGATGEDTGVINQAVWQGNATRVLTAGTNLDFGVHDTGLRTLIDNVDTGLHGYVASDTGIHDAIDNVDTGIAGKIVTAINVDTYAEPGTGAPAATASLVAKVGYLYKAWRNRHTQDTGSYDLYNDDASTVGQTANTVDDGSTFDRGEIGSG